MLIYLRTTMIAWADGTLNTVNEQKDHTEPSAGESHLYYILYQTNLPRLMIAAPRSELVCGRYYFG